MQRIVETSVQLAVVIEDLLTMARSDIDALALNRRPVDLSEPLSDALSVASAMGKERGSWSRQSRCRPARCRCLAMRSVCGS